MANPVTVYQDYGHAALIGPLHAHEVGDEVEPPTREHMGQHLEGYRAVVHRIEADGVAVVRKVDPHAA